jgi:uncharacterized protein YjiS (DUF1127 family)
MDRLIELARGYWEAYNRYHETLRELCSLDDRCLRDIGITRWDIDRVAQAAQEGHAIKIHSGD